MTLTKLVNGVRSEMSAEEEASIRAEWVANELEDEAQVAQEKVDKEAKAVAKGNVLKKLNLTEDEAKALFT